MDELLKDNNIFYNILCFLITENEKLFDRSDAVLYWRTVVHLFGILHHFYIAVFATGLHIETHPNPDIKALYTYGPAFLTGWNFSFQTVFLGLSLIHDILEWLDMHRSFLGGKIKYWRDVIFSGMVFPFTLFVTGMFWSVYAIDRELVFPKVYDNIVPWWFNHCVHTNVTIVLVIETFLQARRKPADKNLELIFYWTIAFLYAIVYYTIYFTTGRWLYQVFGVMNWWQVCLYQLFIWVVSYVFYIAQFPINRLIHGPESNDDTASKDKELNSNTCVKDANKILENEDENEKTADDSKPLRLPSQFLSLTCRNTGNNIENSRL